MTPFADAYAITGSIGAGKSRVAQWLTENCELQLIDADDIVRALLEVGKPGWRQLRSELGEVFFLEDGRVDKASLRRAIFAQPSLRRTIEELLHPLVLEAIAAAVLPGAKEAGRQRQYLVEIPLLYEVGWQKFFSFVIVVSASEARCLERVCARDLVARQQAAAAFHAQLPSKSKEALADYVIYNSGSWLETVEQLQHLKKVLSGLAQEKSLDSQE